MTACVYYDCQLASVLHVPGNEEKIASLRQKGKRIVRIPNEKDAFTSLLELQT
jgi:hypothetical protein